MSQAPGPPSPARLLTEYLVRQQQAQAAGLAAAEPGGDVRPYEAGPVQPIDGRQAWEAAIEAAGLVASASRMDEWQPPPDWPALSSAQESATGLALALGNFPQLVRDLAVFLRAERLSDLRPAAARPLQTPGLTDWAGSLSARADGPQLLLAVGVLRLARYFDEAQAIVARHESRVPPTWRPAWENEKAALAWHAGEANRARSLWLAQPAAPAIHFNRGMASLFLDLPGEAASELQAAVQGLPEASPWHHLGRLYLTLAQMRSAQR